MRFYGQLFLYFVLLMYSIFKKPTTMQTLRVTSFDPSEPVPLEAITDALDLIQQADPRRFRRVLRYIKWIVLGNWRWYGFYYAVGHVCGLKLLSRRNYLEKRLARYIYAAVIVHEATHGFLESKKIARTKRNVLRIEKICRSEHWRFLVMFPELAPSIKHFLSEKRLRARNWRLNGSKPVGRR